MVSAPSDAVPVTVNYIPFSYAHQQSPIRLIELPTTVLSLITPNSPLPLKFKATTPPSTAGPSDQQYNAVLCTPSQTFMLRQVYSSNSIYILQPDAMAGVTIRSNVSSCLELIPVAPNTSSAVALLGRQLKLYTGWDQDEGDDIDKFTPLESDEDKKFTRSWLLGEIPVSDGEFDAAWAECLGFEHRGVAWRPSAGVLVKAMTAMWTGAVATGMKIEASFAVDEMVVAMDDEEVPVGLVEAVVRKVCEEVEGRWRVERERCTKYAGKWVLEDWAEVNKTKKQKNDLMCVSFTSKWKAALPDICRSLCKLDLIKDCHTQPTSMTIRYISPETIASKLEGKTGDVLPIRNKWHEKFRKGNK